ncbi:MAG: ABC transporter permease [Gemmatimonadales bacterium]|nr:ABC transporter permease [Gemmatimonadales bacterium]
MSGPREFLTLSGRWVVEARRALADGPTWRGQLFPQMKKLGVDSVPVAVFVAVFTGIVLALLSSYMFTRAIPLYFVGTLVAKAVMLELGPVLTGMALAGRVGANVAAELGTMRVTEQVDALETLAISPHAYLVTPRVLAATLMFPMVTALAMAVGLLSGWFTAVNLLDLTSVEFLRGARQFYNFKDIWFGLVKSASFGMAVATLGCFQGLNARGGAEGVGRATTRAVVLGCQAILVLDAFWALVLL